MDNFTIAVTIGSRNLKVTSDGTEEGTVFDGKPGDVKMATSSAKRQDPVSFGKFGKSPIANSGFDSPIALTAALYSISPDTVRLVEAPKQVYEFLKLSPENNPEVTETVVKNSNTVNSKVLKKDTPSQKIVRPRYSGKKIKVKRYSGEKIEVVHQTGIYGEVAVSTVISTVCIIWLILFRDDSFASTYGLKEINAIIIAFFSPLLSALCLTISIVRILKYKKFRNISYTFVVLFLGFLPLILLFTPEIGFFPQFSELVEQQSNNSVQGGPWRG